MKKIKQLILFVLVLGPILVSAQRLVKGTVTGEDGELLPGVNIVEKGTDNGASTDFDGNYTLTTEADNAVLEFSFIGYRATDRNVDSDGVINVVLEVDNQQLEEVVIIGYGSVVKKDMTGSVSSIDPNQRDLDNAKSVGDFLTGRAAGVQVNSMGSEPGAALSIKIRGVNSLTSSTEPLYVIDGVIVDSANEDTIDTSGSYASPQNGIAGINPRDIEDIQILKDASATAIYGSRGSNGVVLITTKRGKNGKAKFNFATSTSVGNVANLYDVLETNDYVSFRNDAQESLGYNPAFHVYPDGSFVGYQTFVDDPTTTERLEGISWKDEVFQTSINNDFRLSASGGGDNGNYFVAAGLIKSEGTIPGTSADVADFVINVNQDLSDKLKLGAKISTTYTKNSASQGTESLGSARHNIMKQINSYAPIKDFQENIDDSGVDEADYIDGPMAWIIGYDDLSNDVRLQGAIKLDYKFSDIFTYRVLFGADYRNKERKRWWGNELNKGNQVNGEATLATLNRFRYNIDNTLMFKYKFNKNHKINGTVGVIFDQRKITNTANRASGFADHSLRADGISYGEIYSPVVYIKETETILSFLGRVNYSYKNKYLVSATFRADGSGKFSSENRFSYFPSFALAWNAKNESFLEDVDFVSQLKLRTSWGLTGNQNIPNYRTLTPFNAANPPLSDGSGGAINAFVPTNLANPGLKWETTSQYNAGFDFGIVDNRFTLTTDVYYKEISDLLLDVQVGPSTGFKSYYANQGNLTSKGLEFTVFANVIDKKFSWDVFGNIGFNKNEIKSLGIPVADYGQESYSAFLGAQVSGGRYLHVPVNIYAEGQAPGLFYGYKTDGIINTPEKLASAPTVAGQAPQMGDVYIQDLDGDGSLTGADLAIIGDPNPDFTYGFGTTMSYGNFHLDVMFTGSYGAEIINGNSLPEAYAEPNSKNIRKEAYFDAWSTENPDGTYPRVGYNLADKTGLTDRIVEDASFLRLSNVNFSYNIPMEGVRSIDGINVSVSGQNLLLFTDYSGYDPEITSFPFSKGKVGIDWNGFPNQRRFTLGLNVSF